MPEITYDMIIDNLVSTDIHLNRFELGDYGEILCKTKEDAECIADFLEALLGINDICTSENKSSFLMNGNGIYT